MSQAVSAPSTPERVWGLAAVFRRALKESDFATIMRRSAAVAYYAALSLAPLLVIALSVASLALEREAIRGSVVAEMQNLLGPRGADIVAKVLEESREPRAIVATILGFLMLLFGATGVFVELQDGLNAVWNVEPPRRGGIWKFIRVRLLSAAMVVSFGFLLLVSLLVSATLSAFTRMLNLGELAVVGLVVHFIVAVIGSTLLFAALFKFLPDIHIRWKEALIGALITAILFNVGQILIGQYLGRSSVGSAYGAAGSLVVLLVWIDYSAAIFFFGAEVTQAYATVTREKSWESN